MHVPTIVVVGYNVLGGWHGSFCRFHSWTSGKPSIFPQPTGPGVCNRPKTIWIAEPSIVAELFIFMSSFCNFFFGISPLTINLWNESKVEMWEQLEIKTEGILQTTHILLVPVKLQRKETPLLKLNAGVFGLCPRGLKFYQICWNPRIWGPHFYLNLNNHIFYEYCMFCYYLWCCSLIVVLNIQHVHLSGWSVSSH